MIGTLAREEAIRRLDRLPVRLRAAFAASCAERLYPAYVAYSAFHRGDEGGDPQGLRQALDLVWNWSREGRSSVPEDLTEIIEYCESLIPEEETVNSGYAEDACAAIIYALDTMKGDQLGAYWAASRVYDAVDQYVGDLLYAESPRKFDYERVRQHEIVQSELRCQWRDYEELTKAVDDAGAIPAVVEKLRERAAREAIKLIDDE